MNTDILEKYEDKFDCTFVYLRISASIVFSITESKRKIIIIIKKGLLVSSMITEN